MKTEIKTQMAADRSDDRYRYDSPKPEGLTPEQSKEWDDWDHDRKLLIEKGVFAKGFRVMFSRDEQP